MKKLILAAVIAGAVAGFAPAAADDIKPTDKSCVVYPAYTGTDPGPAGVCSWVATGTVDYVAATPNRWSVTATYVDELGVTRVRQTVGSTSTLSQPTNGTLNLVKAGDTVTVRMESDCAYNPVCGQGGFLGAFEPRQ